MTLAFDSDIVDVPYFKWRIAYYYCVNDILPS